MEEGISYRDPTAAGGWCVFRAAATNGPVPEMPSIASPRVLSWWRSSRGSQICVRLSVHYGTRHVARTARMPNVW